MMDLFCSLNGLYLLAPHSIRSIDVSTLYELVPFLNAKEMHKRADCIHGVHTIHRKGCSMLVNAPISCSHLDLPFTPQSPAHASTSNMLFADVLTLLGVTRCTLTQTERSETTAEQSGTTTAQSATITGGECVPNFSGGNFRPISIKLQMYLRSIH
eukprot:6187694-Pleurochrysis_carterae.AAC.1